MPKKQKIFVFVGNHSKKPCLKNIEPFHVKYWQTASIPDRILPQLLFIFLFPLISAREGFNVTVIGYGGSTPNQNVTTSPNIKLEHLQPFPQWMSRWLPRPISLLLKTFWQLFTILFTLPILRAPHFILMQNPPSIPTLIIGRIYAWCHR